MDNTKHTANYLASRFLTSKRSLSKIYTLSLGAIAILRYICDSIDIHYAKTKKFHTKLYLKQIATYCHCDRDTVSKYLTHLIKKRLIKHDRLKHTFTIGKVLIACGNLPHGIDMRKSSASLRRAEIFGISNSSNITKHTGSTNLRFFDQVQTAPRGETVSPLLAEYMNNCGD